MPRSQWMTFSLRDDCGLGVGEVGAEDALRLGVEVVGAVTQVVGKAKHGALMGNEDIAARTVNSDALATQVAQGGGIIHMASREGLAALADDIARAGWGMVLRPMTVASSTPACSTLSEERKAATSLRHSTGVAK